MTERERRIASHGPQSRVLMNHQWYIGAQVPLRHTKSLKKKKTASIKKNHELLFTKNILSLSRKMLTTIAYMAVRSKNI